MELVNDTTNDTENDPSVDTTKSTPSYKCTKCGCTYTRPIKIGDRYVFISDTPEGLVCAYCIACTNCGLKHVTGNNVIRGPSIKTVDKKSIWYCDSPACHAAFKANPLTAEMYARGKAHREKKKLSEFVFKSPEDTDKKSFGLSRDFPRMIPDALRKFFAPEIFGLETPLIMSDRTIETFTQMYMLCVHGYTGNLSKILNMENCPQGLTKHVLPYTVGKTSRIYITYVQGRHNNNFTEADCKSSYNYNVAVIEMSKLLSSRKSVAGYGSTLNALLVHWFNNGFYPVNCKSHLQISPYIVDMLNP